jgi:dTMP kinase
MGQKQDILKNFIVLEGLDGAGTTTQLKILASRLRERSIPAFTTCEPTSGPVGMFIREILQKKQEVRPETLALLFAADREEHLNGKMNGIRGALEQGRLVVSDRYLFSSLAYQSVSSGFEYVRELNSRFPLPEIVLYLDTPVEVCAERRKKRAAAELFEELEFQKRVAAAYDRTFAFYAHASLRIERLDGAARLEKIAAEIWTILGSLPIVKM